MTRCGRRRNLQKSFLHDITTLVIVSFFIRLIGSNQLWSCTTLSEETTKLVDLLFYEIYSMHGDNMDTYFLLIESWSMDYHWWTGLVLFFCFGMSMTSISCYFVSPRTLLCMGLDLLIIELMCLEEKWL